MDTIYNLQRRAASLRAKTQTDSITPEEVGGLQYDTLAYLADMEQNLDGLGIRKVYLSIADMQADGAPVGTNGKALRLGQLVTIYNPSAPTADGTGNVYAYQKPGWLLVGYIGLLSGVSADIKYLLQNTYYLQEGIGCAAFNYAMSLGDVPIQSEVVTRQEGESIILDTSANRFVLERRGKFYTKFLSNGASMQGADMYASSRHTFLNRQDNSYWYRKADGTLTKGSSTFVISNWLKTLQSECDSTQEATETARTDAVEAKTTATEAKTAAQEAKETVNREIYGSTEIIPVSLSKIISEKGYFNFGSVNVGDAFNYISSPSHSSLMEKYDAIIVSIKAGTRFYLQGYNDGVYYRQALYLIVSKNNVVLAKAEERAYQQDEKSDIFEFDEDCRVFMNVQNSSDENCGAFELVEVINKGLKEEVDELKESGARLPLKGKTIVTIGDSLCTSGIWQNKVCEITGASFDNEKNVDPSYPLSAGGTSMYGTKKDMGLVRVMNIKKLGIDPDIILLENVNDKSAFYVGSGTPLQKRAGELTDKPYIISQVIDDVASLDDWSTNASSILSNIPQDKRKFGTMLMLTKLAQGINIKVTTLPTSDGTFTLSLIHAGQTNTYGITVTAGESADSIIRKILEYDYQNVSDTLADDGISVNFAEEAGVSLRGNYSSNGTGIVLSITDTSTAKIQDGVFFDGESLSDWTDASKWIDIVPLYRAWKGVIEYCNINFPTAKIYICAMINRSGKTSNDYILPNGTYDQESYLSHLARENSLVNALKDIAKMYSIPIIDVAHTDGINISNLDTFYPTPNAHPYVNGYERWGEVIAKEII